MQPHPRHERALGIARAAVEAAAQVAREHFERGLDVSMKADRTPVTDADLAAEKAILAIIEKEDPGVSILAEESGLHQKAPDRRWIVDPIDGTRGFSRGGEFWGPLVALEEDGEVVVGAMALPARKEIYWACKGGGAFKDGTRLQVSQVDQWPEATLSLGEATRLVKGAHGPAVVELMSTAVSTRCFGDLAGAALVLQGLAEVWLEVGVKPWDVAPSKILIEEAGGRWTTFSGGSDLADGCAIGSNGRLHDHALERIAAALG